MVFGLVNAMIVSSINTHDPYDLINCGLSCLHVISDNSYYDEDYDDDSYRPVSLMRIRIIIY